MLLHVKVVGATNVPSMDLLSKSDPFVVIIPSFVNKKLQTSHKNDTDNPVFNEDFTFTIKNEKEDYLYFELYDYDEVGQHDLISTIQIDFNDLFEGEVITKKLEMIPAKGIKQAPIITLQFHMAVRGRPKFVSYKIVQGN